MKAIFQMTHAGGEQARDLKPENGACPVYSGWRQGVYFNRHRRSAARTVPHLLPFIV